MTAHPVGHAGHVVRLDCEWHVLDVGSGHSPHPRADVLLERLVRDDRERSGVPIEYCDARLVVGDACSMPLADGAFDFVIASHIAEHVDDPVRLCGELSRVARAGYIETPGLLGDMLLREHFHRWRVSRHKGGLRFEEVVNPRPLGAVGDLFYGLVYATEERPGHWTLRPKGRTGNLAAKAIRIAMGRLIRAPGIRGWMYTCYDWIGPFVVAVARPRTPPDVGD
jgi:SAM-dependent methyltransferase